ncbi:MAG TPA: DUF6340 family protein [Bacteroidales bacterium]|nr:DUF6340 family protein [Bacteroidales bacterium]HRW95284.1 DUF6340 family protein [Bacteroidales bacterium]
MKAIRTTGLLSVLLLLSACGPLINIMEVDVRLPATRPINILGREMAVFTPQYDSVSVTDSVLLQKFAMSLADALASESYLSPGSVPVFSHYTGSEALGTLDQPDYVHRLALETGTNMVFMVDSVEIGGFFTREVSQVQDDYKLQYLMAPFTSVVRVYDAEKVEFIKYIPLCDTVAWEVWIPTETETVSIPSTAFQDLQRASEYFARELAETFMDQWETQDRVVFVYEKRAWNMAYNHALAFAWDEAMKIWMELVKGTDTKEVACAAFNMALACEMQGNFELAEKWLDLSQKSYDLPEAKYYRELLQERKKQKLLF